MNFLEGPASRFEHWAILSTLRDLSLDRFVSEHPTLDENAKKSFSAWSQRAREAYKLIEPELSRSYDLLELEMLRLEVCSSIIQGHWQGAICLTSILLETFLKLTLVYANLDVEDIDPPWPGGMAIAVSPSAGRFLGLPLKDTINAAREQNLIDEEITNLLHGYREKFRNAYFHADMQLMRGDKTALFLHVDFCAGQIEGLTEIPIHKVPMLLGEEMWQNARENAIPYFKHVDAIIRATSTKVRPHPRKDRDCRE